MFALFMGFFILGKIWIPLNILAIIKDLAVIEKVRASSKPFQGPKVHVGEVCGSPFTQFPKINMSVLVDLNLNKGLNRRNLWTKWKRPRSTQAMLHLFKLITRLILHFLWWRGGGGGEEK